MALDADPVSLDPHVQLSGGMLQYSHLVFDPLDPGPQFRAETGHQMGTH
jgi:hypothetical protein